MSSILTNNSAMVALSTLRDINKGLAETQGNISTGKKIANAKDNAAVWSVSAVMQSDVAGFKAITDSLALGASTLSVARGGAETVNELLTELKGRIVAAQADNVDRGKIQADAAELRNNIGATVEASQFNGLNMLKRDADDPSVEVLASLDRSADGAVTVANIDVQRSSLEQSVASLATVTATDYDVGAPVTAQDLADLGADADLANTKFAEGDTIAVQLTNSGGQGVMLSYAVTAADVNGTATIGNLAAAAATSFGNQLTAAAGSFDGTGIAFSDDAGAVQIAITDTRTTNVDVTAAAGGGLAALSLVDVSTKEGAAAALSAIEGLTQTSIDAAAAFGSSGKRVDIQMDFLKGLTDNLKSGIGSLVDADMEETSARLQALQVQQQLGVQALSIANQQPQTLLSLFR